MAGRSTASARHTLSENASYRTYTIEETAEMSNSD